MVIQRRDIMIDACARRLTVFFLFFFCFVGIFPLNSIYSGRSAIAVWYKRAKTNEGTENIDGTFFFKRVSMWTTDLPDDRMMTCFFLVFFFHAPLGLFPHLDFSQPHKLTCCPLICIFFFGCQCVDRVATESFARRPKAQGRGAQEEDCLLLNKDSSGTIRCKEITDRICIDASRS